MTVFVISNATSGQDILIPDVGVFIPSGGGNEEFTTTQEITSLIESTDLLTLTSDNFGDGNPSLKLNDGTNDIAPGQVTTFLQGQLEDFPTTALRDSINKSLVYVGRKLPSATTADPEWQIYRVDISQVIRVKEYADGDALFDNIWDNRESLTYSAI